MAQGNLQQVFAAIPKTVTSLSLIGNTFLQSGEELAEAFAALGPDLLTLDLYFTELSELPLETLTLLDNSLPYLYLEYDEMVKMGPEKVRTLNDAFPNIENIILTGSPCDTTNLFAKINLLRTLGFRTPPLHSPINVLFLKTFY
ncbi:hypothetical protein [Legionella tunisiensis]|uniref:hypothetical protein n=1 Tax=Legionella tunisiensis TaxID=1034944 RepID=UPI0002ECF863|nr:hypothetical protein [Legionella tunisiensis]